MRVREWSCPTIVEWTPSSEPQRQATFGMGIYPLMNIKLEIQTAVGGSGGLSQGQHSPALRPAAAWYDPLGQAMAPCRELTIRTTAPCR